MFRSVSRSNSLSTAASPTPPEKTASTRAGAGQTGRPSHMEESLPARRSTASSEDLHQIRAPIPEAPGGANAANLDNIRSVYEESRLYHGTGKESKRSIRSHGFSGEHKTDGAVAALRSAHGAGFEGLPAPSFHYLTSDRKRASRYALAAPSGSPALVRTLGVRHDIPLERIMGVDRTSADIPSHYVLGSKKSDPGPESAVFHKELERAGIDVSPESAGQLLRAVQSDSESDFSSDDE